MSEQYTSHYSVLLNECLKFLNDAYEAADDGLDPFFADMTFGGGGHSSSLAKLHSNSRVYSVDQDPDAINNGNDLIQKLGLSKNLFLNKMNYEQFPDWIAENKPELKFHGILMDLGVSSHHFDKFDRGFSFREDAPLDMRMDFQNEKLYTAAEVLNTFDEEDIADIIFKYGEKTF